MHKTRPSLPRSRSAPVDPASPAGAFCRGVLDFFRLYPVGLLVVAPEGLRIAPQILFDSA